MSRGDYLTASGKLTGNPCILYSIVIVTDGGGPGKVDIYDARHANASQKVATLRCPGDQSQQYRWEGLEFTNGLYIEIVEKADYVTVEWDHQDPPIEV